MKVYVANLGKYNEGYLIGQWVQLPIDDDKLDEALKTIGINEYYEEYGIFDFEDEIIDLHNVVSEYSSIKALNELAQRIENLSEYEVDKFSAVLEYVACRSVSDVIELIEQLDEFDLLTNVDDDEGLGYYYAEECCCIDIPEQLKNYFDYEAYGRDIRFEISCLYTTFGCVIDNR